MSEICPVCQSPVGSEDSSCEICGFKLIGTTRGFTPIAADKDEIAEVHHPATAVLRSIRGPRLGAEYILNDDISTIGRNPNSSIFLNDMTVSREHATITAEKGCHVIRDNHSYNGVWVNNKNVDAKALVPGDIIQIGAFAFIYEA